MVMALRMHHSGTYLCSHMLSALGVDMADEGRRTQRRRRQVADNRTRGGYDRVDLGTRDRPVGDQRPSNCQPHPL